MPGVGAFHPPAWPPGAKTCAACGAGLHGETPRGPMRSPPGVEIVLVVLVVPADGRQARQGGGRDQRESGRGRTAILQPCVGAQNRAEAPQWGHQERALPALHALATVLPAFRTTALGRLDRLPLEADRARRGLTPRSPTRLCASRRDHWAPRAGVTPWGTGVIGGALGE